MPEAYIIVFKSVTHPVRFALVSGEPQTLNVIYDFDYYHSVGMPLRPGPLRLSLENRTDTRTCGRPAVEDHQPDISFHRPQWID